VANPRGYYLCFNDVEFIIGLFDLITVNVQFLGMKCYVKKI